MTFALGVNSQYQYRLPCIADVLHQLVPHMWPRRYEVNNTVTTTHVSVIGKSSKSFPNLKSLTYFLGNTQIQHLGSPYLFRELVIDASSPESELFVNDLKVSKKPNLKTF